MRTAAYFSEEVAVFDFSKRQCSKCKQFKPLNEFHRNPSGRGGYRSDCKQCVGLIKKKSYKKNQKEIRDKRRRRYQDNPEYQKNWKQINLDKFHKYMSRTRLKHPEREKARLAVNYAVKKGRLPRVNTLQCFYCGKPARHYHHHHGYDKEHWFDVLPTCYECHGIHDRVIDS